VSRGLVLGHDLALPFIVAWPLKLRYVSDEVRAQVTRHGHAYIDTNKSGGTVADWSWGARAEECHAIARRGVDNRQAEMCSVVLNEEDWHVEWRLDMAMGFVLRCPDALRDDRANMVDLVVEEIEGVPLPVNDGEMTGLGHWRVVNEEGGRPLWDADGSKGVRVLQKPSEVPCCAFWSEHPSDITVDIEIRHGEQIRSCSCLDPLKDR
jgi:hypothetical protein